MTALTSKERIEKRRLDKRIASGKATRAEFSRAFALLRQQDTATTWRRQLTELVANVEFIRSQLDAGGDQEHAATLMIDSVELASANAAVKRMADAILDEVCPSSAR